MFEASNAFTKEKQEKNPGIVSILMLVFKLVSEMMYRLLTIIYNL